MHTQETTPRTPDADETRPETVRTRRGKLAAIAHAGLLGLTGSSFATSLAFVSLTSDHRI
jgi:hypothetical protein